MDKHSRRDFIKTSALSLVSLGLGAAPAAAVGQPHLRFPTDPRQRLGASSYSFRAYIDSPSGYDRDPKLPGIDLKDFGRAVKDKLSLIHIEPWNAHFRSTGPAYLAGLRSTWDKAGVTPINIAAD